MAPIDLHDCCPCHHQGKNDSPCHFGEYVIAVAYFCGSVSRMTTSSSCYHAHRRGMQIGWRRYGERLHHSWRYRYFADR